jgi:hypothetical protein
VPASIKRSKLTILVYISSSTYVIVLGLIKVSIVLFYLELFPTKQFRTYAYLVLVYIIVSSLVIFLLTVFACSPIKAFWDRDINGKCLDVQALAYANSASAIVQDIILLILPLLFIKNLHMQRYRKIAVGLMFTVGTFGCIATFVRLQALLAFKLSLDPTWDFVPVVIWTELELAAAFVCASLPSIRVLLAKVLPTGLKVVFSSGASRSRSRSHSAPKAATPAREWTKPAAWVHISHEAPNSGKVTGNKSSFGGVWNRDSETPSTHRHVRQGSRRLDAEMRNYSGSGVAVTRPPYREKAIEMKRDKVELLEVKKPSKLARFSIRSHDSRDSRITALPKIGCLPEGSYSDLDVRKQPKGCSCKRNGMIMYNVTR